MDYYHNKNPVLDHNEQDEVTLSHHFKRKFKPQKLTPPRGSQLKDSQAKDSKNNQPVTLPKHQFVNIADVASNSPLIIEIGAGKGRHAMQYAQANAQEYMIAIERTKNKFNAFSKKLTQLKANNQTEASHLSNLYLVHADAIAFIVHNIKPLSVDKVFILYPNPEPHNLNQQWLNMPFFEFLLSRLKGNGQIIIASNIESYINNAEKQAQQVWQLACRRHLIAKHSARTHFEIKYLARGERCWELELTKPIQYQTRFDNWQIPKE